MERRKIWAVDIDIVGPITISNVINFRQEKGFDQDQFYSNIILQNAEYGVAATVTAYAESAEIAKMAAFVFLGRMTDVLVFDNGISLSLYDHGELSGSFNQNSTRRLLAEEEFVAAFNIARKLEQEHHYLLKAIGWYAKGMNSNNTLDAFLSFWNAIEISGEHYHTHTDRSESGAINMVYQCFLDYFGTEEQWHLPDRWINDMHDQRNKIAHGGLETTAAAINDVSILIPSLTNVAKRILDAILIKHYPQDIFEQEGWLAIF